MDDKMAFWLPWCVVAVTGMAFLLSVAIRYWVWVHGSRFLVPAVLDLELLISGAVLSFVTVYFWLTGRLQGRSS